MVLISIHPLHTQKTSKNHASIHELLSNPKPLVLQVILLSPRTQARHYLDIILLLMHLLHLYA